MKWREVRRPFLKFSLAIEAITFSISESGTPGPGGTFHSLVVVGSSSGLRTSVCFLSRLGEEVKLSLIMVGVGSLVMFMMRGLVSDVYDEGLSKKLKFDDCRCPLWAFQSSQLRGLVTGQLLCGFGLR